MFYLTILTIISSYFLACWLRPEANFLEKTSLSYFLGFGLVTYLSFLLHIYFGVPFVDFTFIMLLVFLFGLGLVLNRHQIQAIGIIPFLKSTIGEVNFKKFLDKKWLWLLASFGPVVFAIIVTNFWPIRDWDALTLYDFRGRAIYETHSLKVLLEQYSEYYFAYPLYTSLVHTFAYSLGVTNPLPFYSLNLLFFQIIFFSLLKKRTSFFIASICTFFIGFCYPIFSNSLMAYTNLPYSVFILLGIFYAIEWFESPKFNGLWLVLLITGFGLWTRNAEPFWMISLILIMIKTYLTKSFKPLGIALTTYAAFIIPWLYYTNYQVNVTPSPTVVSIFESLKTVNFLYFKNIVLYLYKFFVTPFLLLHAIFTLSVVSAFRDHKLVNLPLVLSICLCYGIVLAGTVLLSLTYSKWLNVGGSLERMSVLFIPLVIFYSAEVLSVIRKQSKL